MLGCGLTGVGGEGGKIGAGDGIFFVRKLYNNFFISKST